MHCYALDLPLNLVRHAFAGTSFSPEGRGERFVAGCQAQINADMEALYNHSVLGGTKEVFAAEAERYRVGYHARLVAYLRSSSRVVSTFIAGPSNFPARRMNKRSAIADRRMEELLEFRRRAMKAAVRNLRPDLRPIMSGDADAIERLEAEIAAAERSQERMKAANLAIRRNAKGGAVEQLASLMEQGFSESNARELISPDSCRRVGFADYKLTNNSANIRRMRQRLETLAVAKAAPVVSLEGVGGIRLEDDPPANRIRLFFAGKPEENTRASLKSNGFRWTPSLGAWQAFRNPWSIRTAKQVAGIDEGALA